MADGPINTESASQTPPNFAEQAKNDPRIENSAIKQAGETGIGVVMKGKDFSGNEKPQSSSSGINQENQTLQKPVTHEELLEKQQTLEAERKRKADEINQGVQDFISGKKNASNTNKS